MRQIKDLENIVPSVKAARAVARCGTLRSRRLAVEQNAKRREDVPAREWDKVSRRIEASLACYP